MKKLLSILFLIIFLGSLFFPLISLAGTYMAIDEGGDLHPIYYDGLVPCGKIVCETDKIKEIEERLKEGMSFEQACRTVGGTPIKKVVDGQEIGLPCTFCHFFVMLDGIIDFILFKLIPPLAVLMLVIGGVMYMMAYFGEGEGEPKMLSQAKKIFTSVVIGLIIIYGGWLIVNMFFRLIGVEAWTGLESGWFSIKCPIVLPD